MARLGPVDIGILTISRHSSRLLTLLPLHESLLKLRLENQVSCLDIFRVLPTGNIVWRIVRLTGRLER